ncbi:MAG TPA: sigma-70 family RNA polymerase sigma factor [Minicystis sp.]|nr:sigma-70 family RNA polymerase sigma factor [Minicystis sp.]
MTESEPSTQLVSMTPPAVAQSSAAAVDDVFRAIFAADASYVWNVLRRLRVREADLADLTHEVFLVLHRRLCEGSFDGARSARAWLAATAYRVASVHMRSASQRRELLGDGEEAPVPSPGRDPEQELAAAEDRAAVLSALEALPPERRIVFVMHEIDREPVPAIAEALGIPVNTAYSRLRIGRDEFRAAVRRMRAAREVHR